MRFVYFTHSLVSDWNHGNAHFQRGVLKALQRLGHEVTAFEPNDGWSISNLRSERGQTAERSFAARFPTLTSRTYSQDVNIDAAVDGADVVLVHEWNEPWLVGALGRARAGGGRFRLLFHDTHHRAVSDPAGLDAFDLEAYDGVLAFGEAIREIYAARGWADRVWTWHEAADTDLFHPISGVERVGDLIWIGNWGDDERGQELREFLIEPVADLRLGARVHGVRYPAQALEELRSAGIRYGGWIANAEVPDAFARHRLTVHVPRRYYAERLPGIPTIRVFEALACGIPLVSAPWRDSEGLFRAGTDFLFAKDGLEMKHRLSELVADPDLRESLSRHGRETILKRHTCDHRARELLSICETLGVAASEPRRVVA